MEIPIEVLSDDKGYFDRECPNEECEFLFKIHMEDWKSKISDEIIYCPRCGYTASSDHWWTQQQINQAKELALQLAMSQIQEEIHRSFKKVSRSSNKYFKISYKPGKKITFQNNPIGQQKEWELEICCDQCGTRTSVIGTAYFCPCCGTNAVDRLFNESMDRIKKQLNSLTEIQTLLEDVHDKGTAANMIQNMIETSLKDVVSAFQKFAVEAFRKSSTKSVTPNDFQIIDKGSTLFKKHYGVSYDEWLTSEELQIINVMFQRRHILEHNQGIIDDKYLYRSQDATYRIGQRIFCKKTDVEQLIEIIKDLSECISSVVEVNEDDK